MQVPTDIYTFAHTYFCMYAQVIFVHYALWIHLCGVFVIPIALVRHMHPQKRWRLGCVQVVFLHIQNRLLLLYLSAKRCTSSLEPFSSLSLMRPPTVRVL